jgi:hypothetical protein
MLVTGTREATMNVHHGPLELATSRRARNRRLGAVLSVFALVSTALGTFAREPAPAAAPLSAGMVSINFDDGLRSQWTLAHQQMVSRGRTTWCPVRSSAVTRAA